MRVEEHDLTPDSPGQQMSLTCLRFGRPGARPKAYLQAGLHADEMPGPLVLHHLRGLLEQAEARGQIRGEVLLVPLANPIGLAQWVQRKPQGRQDLGSMQNFNRGYPDLAALCQEALQGHLGTDPARNLAKIRAAFGQALRDMACPTQNADLRRALMLWSHDADHVLDLHCDHFALMHLYASSARPEETRALARAVGARLVLVEEISGGNAFDEAHTAPYPALRAQFGPKVPIPTGAFSTTLEYRGQFDVSDAQAASDAANLMIYLAGVGVVAGPTDPQHDDPPHLPLSGAVEALAPQGGIVTWAAALGDEVQKGQAIAHVTDPTTGKRLAVQAPVTGLLFRQELWRSCLRGQGLAHVAGQEKQRDGHLLSD